MYRKCFVIFLSIFLCNSYTSYAKYSKEEYGQYLKESTNFREAIDILNALQKAMTFCLSDNKFMEYEIKSKILSESTDNNIDKIITNGVSRADAYAILLKRNANTLLNEYKNICMKDIKLSSVLVNFMENYTDYYGDHESKPIIANFPDLLSLTDEEMETRYKSSDFNNYIQHIDKQINSFISDMYKKVYLYNYHINIEDLKFICKLIEFIPKYKASFRVLLNNAYYEFVIIEVLKKLTMFTDQFSSIFTHNNNYEYYNNYKNIKPDQKLVQIINEIQKFYSASAPKINSGPLIAPFSAISSSGKSIYLYNYLIDKESDYFYSKNNIYDINYIEALVSSFTQLVQYTCYASDLNNKTKALRDDIMKKLGILTKLIEDKKRELVEITAKNEKMQEATNIHDRCAEIVKPLGLNKEEYNYIILLPKSSTKPNDINYLYDLVEYKFGYLLCQLKACDAITSFSKPGFFSDDYSLDFDLNGRTLNLLNIELPDSYYKYSLKFKLLNTTDENSEAKDYTGRNGKFIHLYKMINDNNKYVFNDFEKPYNIFYKNIFGTMRLNSFLGSLFGGSDSTTAPEYSIKN